MKRFLGLVFAPALALILMDPAVAKTIRPEGFGLAALAEKIADREGAGGQRQGGFPGAVLSDRQNILPLPPLTAKKAKLRHGFVFDGTPADDGLPKGKIVGDLLTAGAQHRKAAWPDLDFSGHGHKRRGPVRDGGAGGWDEGPGDPVVLPGDGPDDHEDPEDHTGGPTDGGNPFIPDEEVDHEDQGDAISPVPLPAAGWLMVAALGGLAAVGRRRYRA